MKKVLSLAVAAMMAVMLAAGIGQEQPAFAADTSKEVTLKWMYHGSTVIDDMAVMDEVNALLKEKINAKLEMIWCTWGDFNDRVQLAINSGDDIDIYFTCSWSANEYVATAKKGAYVRLDDPENNLIEKYAPDLFESIPEVLADAAVCEGAEGTGIYAIPTYKEIAQQYTWDINTPLLEEYGFSVDDINDYYELGPILEAAKQDKGINFYPLNVEPAVLERMVNNVDVVDAHSLLSYFFDPVHPSESGTEIYSKYETPEYKKFVEKTREYFLAGYINPAMSNEVTMSDTRTAAALAGEYLIGTQVYAPGYDVIASKERGFDVTFKPAQAGIISTTPARGAMHAISVTSKNPERAMMLLNEVNNNAELFTLLGYGVEGIHYNWVEDRVEFTDAKQDYMPWQYGLGKIMQYPLTVDDDADKWEQFDKFNDAEAVPILGFTFDTKPVEIEVSTLINITKEYADPLNAGVVGPALKLDEFISKLKANGIDKVVEEANKQLQEFLESK